MTRLTQRGSTANKPAKLPALQASRITDPHTQTAVEALREWVEVRLGSRGDFFERAVTQREFKPFMDDMLLQLTKLQGVVDELERWSTEERKDEAASTGTSNGVSQSEFDALLARVTTLENAVRSLSSSVAPAPWLTPPMTGLVNGLATVAGTLAAWGLAVGASNGAATASAQTTAVGQMVGASSGVAIASGVSPNIGDLYFSNVLLLMHYEGANNTPTFTDNSSYNHGVFAQSGAVISNAQAKFGASAFQAGAGTARHLYVVNSANSTWQMTGDFTFEQWIYPLSQPVFGAGSSSMQMLFANRQNSDATRVFLGYANWDWMPGIGFWFQINNGGDNFTLSNTGTLALNTWHHVAVTRQNVAGTNTYRILVNGSVVAATTSNITYPVPPNDHIIGRGWDGNFPADMWFDEVRVTKGVARYTGAYTVPTAPFPDF